MKPGPDFPTACALCGKDPAGGQATVYQGEKVIRLCHDDGPVGNGGQTCYEQWTPRSEVTVEQDFYHNDNGRNA
jgi:hypothetical protein